MPGILMVDHASVRQAWDGSPLQREGIQARWVELPELVAAARRDVPLAIVAAGEADVVQRTRLRLAQDPELAPIPWLVLGGYGESATKGAAGAESDRGRLGRLAQQALGLPLRAHRRRSVALPCRIYAREDEHPGTIRDLGAGGLRLRLPLGIELEPESTLIFTLPLESRATVRARARTVRRHGRSAALAFTQIGSRDRTALAEFVEHG